MAGRREESMQDMPAELPMGEFNARFRKPLMAFFLRRVPSHGEAEDMTQEVFVRLLRHEGSVCTASAQAYVFQIATNLLRDRRRRAQTHAETMHSSIDAPGEAHPAVPALIEDRSPDRVFTGQEDLRAAIAMLDELGERTRDIFLLFRVEKMKQREIAALYGISVSAVEKHVVKAAAHLAQRFGRS